MSKVNDIVWISEEAVYGVVVRYGAYFTLVRYEKGGLEYEVWVENEDIELREEHANEYEQE